MDPPKVNPTIELSEINPSEDASLSSQPQPPPISDAATIIPHHASSSSSNAAPSQRLMYKNRLQEFAQRSNITLPVYQTVNDGSPHAPRFRSSVWVNGKGYTSPNTFSQRKAAEQDVARVALEGQTVMMRDEGCPLVCENTSFSKSILNEYATKMNLERPTYHTIQLEGLLPLFVSSLVFNGTKYTGDTARNKKEAEQLAARAAILSILGDSSSGALYEIVKSKSRIYAAVKPNKSEYIDASTVPTIENTGYTSVSLDSKYKDIAGQVAANNSEICQESQMPKPAPSLEGTGLPNMSLQPGAEQSIGDSSSSKKRRKNKKKADKKARLENPLPVAAFSLKEIPPCSVAQ